MGKMRGCVFRRNNLADLPAVPASRASVLVSEGQTGVEEAEDVRFVFFTFHPRLGAGGAGLSHAARRGVGVEASALVGVVILVVSAMSFKEVGASEALGADLSFVFV